MNETIGDLARSGRLVGRRVRFLADDIPTWVPKGTIGVVKYVSDVPRVLVDFERGDKPDKSAFRHIDLETRLECIELVD